MGEVERCVPRAAGTVCDDAVGLPPPGWQLQGEVRQVSRDTFKKHLPAAAFSHYESRDEVRILDYTPLVTSALQGAALVTDRRRGGGGGRWVGGDTSCLRFPRSLPVPLTHHTHTYIVHCAVSVYPGDWVDGGCGAVVGTGALFVFVAPPPPPLHPQLPGASPLPHALLPRDNPVAFNVR